MHTRARQGERSKQNEKIIVPFDYKNTRTQKNNSKTERKHYKQYMKRREREREYHIYIY